MSVYLKVALLILVASVAWAKPVPEYPTSKVKELIKKIKNEQKYCTLPPIQRPAICRSKKLLSAMEGLLESYLSVQERANREVGKNSSLTEKYSLLEKQNTMMSNTLKAQREPASVESDHGCLRKMIFDRLLTDLGVSENGSLHYIKRLSPIGDGVCWTNSKKKKEASVTLCNYPGVVSVETKGGSERYPTQKRREFYFSVNGCDLMSVYETVNKQGQTTETHVTYDQCITQWNKRTADAAMTLQQVAMMEDTIGFCFRENLLPPRAAKNGRENPSLPRPKSP